MNKEITAIIMYWYPYAGPLQPIYKSIFTHLTANGYKINIIAGMPHYRKGREELWREYKGVFLKQTIEDKLYIKRTFVLSPTLDILFDKNGIFRRTINYFSFFISAFFTIMFDRKFKSNFIFTLSFPAFFSGLLAVLISTVKNLPFVYNVQDVNPDLLFSIKLFRAKPVSYILGKIEKFIYRRAKIIVAISDRIKDTLIEKGVPFEKIVVIPNFCDTELIKPLPKKNEFTKKYNLESKFVVLYAGNMGEPQGIEFIIEAARLLRNRDILFMFIGRGERKSEAEKLVRQQGLKNVIFIPLQPLYKMPQIWASADVSLVSLRKNISHLAFPSKIYSILSSGRPIITVTDKNSEIWNFIEMSRGGVCAEAENANDLAHKVEFLYNNPDLRERMGRRGREFAEKNFSKELVIQKYKLLFDKL